MSPGRARNMASNSIDDVTELSRGMAGFACGLYDQFSRQNPEANLFFSVLSIATALGMTLAGAKGDTARQLTAALKLNTDDDSVHSAFEKLFAALNSNGAKYILTSANNMFVDSSFVMLDDFLRRTQSFYKCEQTNLDFARDAEAARHAINAWVENSTNRKIKEIIPPGMLSPDVVLVLVNAIYFKAKWEKQFDPYPTKVKPFILSDGEEVPVDMMLEVETYPIGNLTELDCQVLELHYRGKQLSMFILLPNQIDGLADLEKRLTPDILMSAQTVVSDKEVEVSLPKFKIEFSSEMSEILQQLGITDMFLPGVADLTGVTDTQPGKLFVSNVVHKTFVSVDEKGTEAAAVTATEILLGARIPEFEFNANHPFLFFIQHKETGAILFTGRLTKPEVAANTRDEL